MPQLSCHATLADMLGIADYGAFVLAIIIFLAIPGPGNIAIITSTAKGGRLGGFAAAVGVICGDQVLLWLAVAGVAALLKASPVVFQAVQWLGAAYLLYVGYRIFRTRPGDTPVIDIKPRHYLRQAMTITLLNPKAIVFYMAFFPLFVDPAQHQGITTFAVMAATIAALTLMYCAVVITLTKTFAERLRASPRVTRALNRLAGGALMCFGLKLALSR